MRFSVTAYGRALFVLTPIIALAACSGSGSRAAHTLPAAPAANSTYTGPTGSASLTFTIPAASTTAASGKRRTPAYVSSASATIDVTASNGTNSIPTTGLSLAGRCATTGTSRVCTVSIDAPVGNDTFTITLKDASANALSTTVTSTSVTIAEGTANVIPPLVLNPIAATFGLTYNSSPAQSTAANPVLLGIADAAGMTVGGLGTYVDASDVAQPLTMATIGTSSGGFSASSTCSAQAQVFSPWTTTSAIYFCPSGAATLGSLYTFTLGAAHTTISMRRNGNSTASGLAAEPNPGPGFTSALGVSGDDGLSTFAITGFDIGFDELEIGSYSTSAAWKTCSNPSYTYAVPLMTRAGTFAIAAAQGHARLDQFNVGGTCTASGLSLSTGSDVVAMMNDPNSPTTAYAISTDDSTVDRLAVINTGTMIQAALAVPYCQPSGSYSYPHTLAMGPGSVVYVGCDNGTTVSAYTTQPSFSSTATHITTASAPYSETGVAANLDIAYAVASGPGVASNIYILINGTAALVATLPSASDVVDAAQALVVGNDDQLYMAVNNGGTRRVVAYDPYSNALIDPAIVISSILQNTSPIQLSLGNAGKIIVSGLRPDYEVGAVYWPN